MIRVGLYDKHWYDSVVINTFIINSISWYVAV
jgi:hypothetical protein